MKRIITWLLVVSLCLVPVEFSQAGEVTYSVVLQGLSSSADIKHISAAFELGLILNSYAGNFRVISLNQLIKRGKRSELSFVR